ncbi:hypothetical protein B4113_2605 [Geobacillus sp. B4113_201601]|nr:hypothetical protein B4113_2605 [Geobacillus sp. B4113_201601]
MQEAINMSPSWEHQIVCDNLVSMIKGKSPCQLSTASFSAFMKN